MKLATLLNAFSRFSPFSTEAFSPHCFCDTHCSLPPLVVKSQWQIRFTSRSNRLPLPGYQSLNQSSSSRNTLIQRYKKTSCTQQMRIDRIYFSIIPIWIAKIQNNTKVIYCGRYLIDRVSATHAEDRSSCP